MEGRVKEMSERLNTPVRILRTPEEIKAYARNSREANAKGITRINGNRATDAIKADIDARAGRMYDADPSLTLSVVTY